MKNNFRRKTSFWHQAATWKLAILLTVLFTCTGDQASFGFQPIEKRVLFKPQPMSRNWDQPLVSELTGLIFEDVSFVSLDGTKLHGWFIEPATEVEANPNLVVHSKTEPSPQNVILFTHGRGSNVSQHKAKLLEFVRRNQVSIFAFDYRGYGKSDGTPSEAGLYQDTEAARDWLAKRKNIPPQEVILMGRSLGAAMAIDLAARDCAKALIVEAGFTSVADVLRYHSRKLLTGRRLNFEFNSREKIGSYTGPVLISHGKDDKAIPFVHGKQLAEAAKSASSVKFVELEGGHLTPPSEEYKTTLSQFLEQLR